MLDTFHVFRCCGFYLDMKLICWLNKSDDIITSSFYSWWNNLRNNVWRMLKKCQTHSRLNVIIFQREGKFIDEPEFAILQSVNPTEWNKSWNDFLKMMDWSLSIFLPNDQCLFTSEGPIRLGHEQTSFWLWWTRKTKSQTKILSSPCYWLWC